jgi:hypothetical protein
MTGMVVVPVMGFLQERSKCQPASKFKTEHSQKTAVWIWNLLIAVSENQATVFVYEGKAEGIATRAWNEDTILDLVCSGDAVEVERRSRVGRQDVEGYHVVVGALRLAPHEFGDHPVPVANGAGVLASLEGCRADKAAGGEEERGDGVELHFDGWKLLIVKRLLSSN